MPLLKVTPCHDTKSRTEWPVIWCYQDLSSTNLPVLANPAYGTIRVRPWLFKLTLVGFCYLGAGAAVGLERRTAPAKDMFLVRILPKYISNQ